LHLLVARREFAQRGGGCFGRDSARSDRVHQLYKFRVDERRRGRCRWCCCFDGRSRGVDRGSASVEVGLLLLLTGLRGPRGGGGGDGDGYFGKGESEEGEEVRPEQEAKKARAARGLQPSINVDVFSFCPFASFPCLFPLLLIVFPVKLRCLWNKENSMKARSLL